MTSEAASMSLRNIGRQGLGAPILLVMMLAMVMPWISFVKFSAGSSALKFLTVDELVNVIRSMCLSLRFCTRSSVFSDSFVVS